MTPFDDQGRAVPRQGCGTAGARTRARPVRRDRHDRRGEGRWAMSLSKSRRVGAAALCALALVAAGGGKSTRSGGKSGNKGVKGGILKLAGLKDITHYDTNQAYEVRAWGFHLRATTRQLMSYENTTDPKLRDTPVPDLAASDPTISADGLTYDFTSKSKGKFAPPTHRD